MISFHEDAIPIWGLAKSSSPMPTALSMPRAAALAFAGIATAQPDAAIFSAKAFETANTQIGTTYKAQLDQAAAAQNALNTKLRGILDANKDGKLSQQELFARTPAMANAAVPPDRQAQRQSSYFQRMDSDRDGSISMAEFMAQAPKLVQDAKGAGKTDAWAGSTYRQGGVEIIVALL